MIDLIYHHLCHQKLVLSTGEWNEQATLCFFCFILNNIQSCQLMWKQETVKLKCSLNLQTTEPSLLLFFISFDYDCAAYYPSLVMFYRWMWYSCPDIAASRRQWHLCLLHKHLQLWPCSGESSILITLNYEQSQSDMSWVMQTNRTDHICD